MPGKTAALYRQLTEYLWKHPGHKVLVVKSNENITISYDPPKNVLGKGTPMAHEGAKEKEQAIDVTNHNQVSVRDDTVVIMRPHYVMKKADALLYAAWLVALADDNHEFDAILEAVYGAIG